MEKDIVNIGKSVVIKGELMGSEDLTIEGHVEGTIQLRDHVLTIGPNGRIKAQVFAKSVIVLGEVTGNVTASDKVDIRENGSVDGDLIAPRVAIAEGAHFRGSVDMQRKGGVPAQAKPDAPTQAVKAQAPPPQAAAPQTQPAQQPSQQQTGATPPQHPQPARA
jgi:cytoskeletal protein CcmA (bactofilin family)